MMMQCIDTFEKHIQLLSMVHRGVIPPESLLYNNYDSCFCCLQQSDANKYLLSGHQDTLSGSQDFVMTNDIFLKKFPDEEGGHVDIDRKGVGVGYGEDGVSIEGGVEYDKTPYVEVESQGDSIDWGVRVDSEGNIGAGVVWEF